MWTWALDWFAETPPELLAYGHAQPDPVTAWTNCERADWMLWALARGGVDRPRMVEVVGKFRQAQLDSSEVAGVLAELSNLAVLRAALGGRFAQLVADLTAFTEGIPSFARRVRRLTWPRAPHRSFEGCREAFFVARDLWLERQSIQELPTVTWLVALSIRHQLLSMPVELRDAERWVVHGLAEVIAMSDDPRGDATWFEQLVTSSVLDEAG